MSSKLSKIVLVFLVLLVLGLGYVNFFTLNKSTLKMSLPVDENKLSTIPKYAENSDHLIFNLDEGEPIYAVFDGTVTKFVPAGPQLAADNIQLKSKDGHLVLSYLISGQSFVKEGEEIKKGQLIAKARTGRGPGVLAGANLGVYLFKDGELTPLTKEGLLQLSGVKNNE